MATAFATTVAADKSVSHTENRIQTMFGLDLKWRVELDPNEIRKGMAELKWFHHIDLGHGIVTPGAGGPNWNELLERSADIYYGMGIEGQTVLEVGAFDGFMLSRSIMELSSASRQPPRPDGVSIAYACTLI